MLSHSHLSFAKSTKLRPSHGLCELLGLGEAPPAFAKATADKPTGREIDVNRIAEEMPEDELAR